MGTANGKHEKDHLGHDEKSHHHEAVYHHEKDNKKRPARFLQRLGKIKLPGHIKGYEKK